MGDEPKLLKPAKITEAYQPSVTWVRPIQGGNFAVAVSPIRRVMFFASRVGVSPVSQLYRYECDTGEVTLIGDTATIFGVNGLIDCLEFSENGDYLWIAVNGSGFSYLCLLNLTTNVYSIRATYGNDGYVSELATRFNDVLFTGFDSTVSPPVPHIGYSTPTGVPVIHPWITADIPRQILVDHVVPLSYDFVTTTQAGGTFKVFYCRFSLTNGVSQLDTRSITVAGSCKDLEQFPGLHKFVLTCNSRILVYDYTNGTFVMLTPTYDYNNTFVNRSHYISTGNNDRYIYFYDAGRIQIMDIVTDRVLYQSPTSISYSKGTQLIFDPDREDQYVFTIDGNLFIFSEQASLKITARPEHPVPVGTPAGKPIAVTTEDGDGVGIKARGEPIVIRDHLQYRSGTGLQSGWFSLKDRWETYFRVVNTLDVGVNCTWEASLNDAGTEHRTLATFALAGGGTAVKENMLSDPVIAVRFTFNPVAVPTSGDIDARLVTR